MSSLPLSYYSPRESYNPPCHTATKIYISARFRVKLFAATDADYLKFCAGNNGHPGKPGAKGNKGPEGPAVGFLYSSKRIL
jgi:hypothetical protein